MGDISLYICLPIRLCVVHALSAIVGDRMLGSTKTLGLTQHSCSSLLHMHVLLGGGREEQWTRRQREHPSLGTGSIPCLVLHDWGRYFAQNEIGQRHESGHKLPACAPRIPAVKNVSFNLKSTFHTQKLEIGHNTLSASVAEISWLCPKTD